MTTTKHTPGPWEAISPLRSRVKGWCVHGTFTNNGKVAQTYGWKPEMAEANARLIASAPELLEALKQITEAFGSVALAIHLPDGVNLRNTPAFNDAIKAIAKADGRE